MQALCRPLDAVPHQTLCKLFMVLYKGPFDFEFVAKLKPNAALLASVPESIAEEFSNCSDDPNGCSPAWMSACLHLLPLDESEEMSSFRHIKKRGPGVEGAARPTSGTPARDKLQLQTVVQLKAQLVERGLKVSGKKGDLIDRLLEDLTQSPNAPDGQPDTAAPAAAAGPEQDGNHVSPPQVTAAAAVGGAADAQGGGGSLETSLKKMTVAQLKDLLRENNCKVSGKKKELVERCVANGLSAN